MIVPVREERWSEAARIKRLGYPPLDLEPGMKFARRSIAKVLSLADIDEVWNREDRNIGIFLEPKNLIVFDADSEEAEDWLKKHDLHSNTVAKTPRGMHLYFRHEHQGLTTKIKYDGIPLDIKTTGHVVAPGSIVDGKVYDWLEGPRHVGLLPLVPDRIIEKIRESMKRSIEPPALPQTPGRITRRDIKDPIAYAMRIESIQGQGGSKGLVRAVCVLRDCGWDPAKIYDFMVSVWNLKPTTNPPWNPKDIERAVQRHCK